LDDRIVEEGTGMRRVTAREESDRVTIEVDGELDTVASHDLRAAMVRFADQARTLTFDLTRVAGVDADGVRALEWCSRLAIERRTVLRWSGCSGPLLDALRRGAGR
jgi:ABC-type transporter Mla MlaB component